MSIVEGLKKSVAQTPEKLASICGSTRLTFSEVDDRVNRLSNGLARLGVGPGDRVAILSANRAEFLLTFLGTMQAGMVSVPVNFKLPPDTVAYIMDDSDAKLAMDIFDRGECQAWLSQTRFKTLQHEARAQAMD